MKNKIEVIMPDFGLLADHAMHFTEEELKLEFLRIFEQGRALGRWEGSETEWQRIWDWKYATEIKGDIK